MRKLVLLSTVVTCLTGMVGCQTINAIPVGRLPAGLLNGDRKEDMEDTSFLRLRQDPPEVYKLGPGDILGVYIENVLGLKEELPPVHYPEDSNLPPAIGFPVPIREDGTIALPLIDPINLEGLTLIEATNKIRSAYIRGELLAEGKDRTIVTLIKQRTTRVLVIREESGGLADVTKRGTGNVVDLPAYENDVLHALNKTGGLPGTDAKNEILIYRGMYKDASQYEHLINSLCTENSDPCYCDPSPKPDPPNLVRIPMRYLPSNPPQFTEKDIILNEGDIVVIKARDDEVFFTGGHLGGGEFPLPRDKDLDAMAAVAVAGGSVGSVGTGVGAVGGQGGSAGGRGGAQYCSPSQLIILRKLPCGQQLTLKVDLKKAVEDPSERILIQPNDVLILRYTITEEIGNVLLNLVQFNFLFNGFNGGGFSR